MPAEHMLIKGLVALNDSVLMSGLQGAASADDVMGAVTHFIEQMAAEELNRMLTHMECTIIELDVEALQSERGRTAAVGWILRHPKCSGPAFLLQLAEHRSLQNYLFKLTDNSDVQALSQSQCIKSILTWWGRPRSGEHVRALVSSCLLFYNH